MKAVVNRPLHPDTHDLNCSGRAGEDPLDPVEGTILIGTVLNHIDRVGEPSDRIPKVSPVLQIEPGATQIAALSRSLYPPPEAVLQLALSEAEVVSG